TPLNPAEVVTTGEGDLYGSGFISWAKRMVRSLGHMTGSAIKRELRDWGCSNFNRNGKRGLDFPPLPELRRLFEKRYGPQDWENPELEAWETPPGALAGDKVSPSRKSLS